VKPSGKIGDPNTVGFSQRNGEAERRIRERESSVSVTLAMLAQDAPFLEPSWNMDHEIVIKPENDDSVPEPVAMASTANQNDLPVP
jgi:hypothetical protein